MRSLLLLGILAASLTLNLTPRLASAAEPATAPTVAPAATDVLVCNHVRILPRAGFPQLVKGAIIQGSNSGPTADFVDLATVSADAQDGQWLEVKFENIKVYRFLRYYAPPGSWGNVAQLEFYHHDAKLRGRPFGTWGTREDKNTYDKAFDGDPKTFFDAPLADDQYAGIELIDLPSTVPAVVTTGGARKDGAHSHFHIGNSLTDTEGEYMQAIAKAAGFSDDYFDRNTIPGAPIHAHWSLAIRRAHQGFGTPAIDAAVKLTPLNDLVLQVFVQNGDTSDPTPLVGFYDLFKEHSPGVRLWVYGQWPEQTYPTCWEDGTLALMRIYYQAARNVQQMRPLNPPVAVIPGGYALINLKHAIEQGELPGIEKDAFFANTFDDGIHLSDMGRYYIGLVHYACIYGKTPVGIPPIPLGKDKHLLSPEMTTILEQLAWSSVQTWQAAPEKVVACAVPGELNAYDNIGTQLPTGRETTMHFWGRGGEVSYYITPSLPGVYELKVHGLLDSTTPKGADVYLNEALLGTMQFPVVPDKHGPYIESMPFPLRLTAGINTLRLVMPKGDGYTLDTLRISKPSLPSCNAIIMGMDVEPGQTATKTFKVCDDETPAGEIKVTMTSANEKSLPANALSCAVSEDGTCTLSIKHPGQAGGTWVLITITNNAGLSRAFTFPVKYK